MHRTKTTFTSYLLIVFLLFSASCSEKALEKKPWDVPSSQLPGRMEIKINPMMELDFKSKKQVYDIRKKFVKQRPQLMKYLAGGDYEPSKHVFGQIQDGKSWWGILGICYYGNGKRSIEGPSEETRFICNPYLLAGLIEIYARRIRNKSLDPKAIYPKPSNLVWNMKKGEAEVTYDVSGYFKEAARYRYPAYRKMCIAAYNARDMGFPYFCIEPKKADKVIINKQDKARINPQFIHTGGSSGYPCGSNNMSPNFSPLNIEVKKIPADVVIRLWRKAPKNVDEKPDMKFVIHMK